MLLKDALVVVASCRNFEGDTVDVGRGFDSPRQGDFTRDYNSEGGRLQKRKSKGKCKKTKKINKKYKHRTLKKKTKIIKRNGSMTKIIK